MKVSCWKYVSLIIMITFLLSLLGCASSGAQRGAAGEVDKAYIAAQYDINHFNDGNIANSYQNTSQTTKGAVLGAATGATAGGLGSMGVWPGLFTGAIIGGAIGAYIDQTSTLADKLENHGVKVIELGDQLMLVIPSSQVFNPLTPDLQPTAYPTLDLIAAYINSNPNMTVKIAAYTSNMGSCVVNQAMSQQQAENIEKYLWRKQVNTRVLTAFGYGGVNLVTKDNGAWFNDNYRIEITLEKVPV